MRATSRRTLVDDLRAVTRTSTERAALAEAVCATVGRHVPFVFACLATTDPATGLISWAYKTHDLGGGVEEWAASEYGAPDVNSLTDIARRDPPVGALCVDTEGHPERCRRHREYMAPAFGFTDELRVVFRSRGASWGAMALYRGAGDPPFDAADAARLGEVHGLLAEAVQRSLFRVGPTGRVDAAAKPDPLATAPAVLLIAADDRVTHRSAAADAALDELGGSPDTSLPDSVLAAVAATRTADEPTDTRVSGLSGRWLAVRAAPLAGPPGSRDVVVTVEPAPRSAISRLALAAHGLTAREEEVALLVLQGADTRAIAAALHLSPHTVQDHLKVVFSKLGVSSRREMTARLVLA